jgi:hypothetical protein
MKPQDRDLVIRIVQKKRIRRIAMIAAAIFCFAIGGVLMFVLYPIWFMSDQSHGVLHHATGSIVAYAPLSSGQYPSADAGYQYYVAVDHLYLSGTTAKVYEVGEKVAVDYTIGRSGIANLDTITPLPAQHIGSN